MPPVVAAAGIGAAASLIGGAINSKGAKGVAKVTADSAKLAMDEQKRIYEDQKKIDEERYQTTRKDTEYDRAKTLADESRVRASRGAAFGGFGNDLSTFSKGYAPAYGMSGAQTQGLMDARNAGVGGGGGYVAPSMGDKGLGPGPDPMSPSMPKVTPGGPSAPAMPGPSASMGSTVWLQAPTGEQMEVSLQDAPKIQQMLSDGAILIPAPTGGQ